MKEELEEIQRFKLSTETELSSLAEFCKQTKTKLMSLQVDATKFKMGNETLRVIASPGCNAVQSGSYNDDEFTMEDINMPQK